MKVGKIRRAEEDWVSMFGCMQAKLPITYLRLPLGGNPNREAWGNPILNKIRLRLALWKRNFMTKGGRLVLIKSVLSSLPTYGMSVFRILIGVANHMEKLQREFFWNDCIAKRRLHSVDWNTICLSKRKGGLEVGQIAVKGSSLLAKWI